MPGSSVATSYVAPGGSHQVLEWLNGATMEVLLDAAHTNGSLTVVRTALNAGDAAPLHVHTSEDEVFLLLSGSALVWAGDDRYEVGPGGIAYLPRDIPHTYRVTQDGTDMLTICTPGGMDTFFRRVGHDVSTPKPEGWAITPASLGAAAAAGGQQILGPPPRELDD